MSNFKKDKFYRTMLEGKHSFMMQLFIILTTIAAINSIQSYYVFVKGNHTLINFIPYIFSKMYFMWYFLLLAVIVRRLTLKIAFNVNNIINWVMVHGSVLIVSLVVHHTLSYWLDKLILGNKANASLYVQLFNNPGVWVDIVMYFFFLIGFYMIEYKKKNEENEIKVSRIEVELITSRLHELRNRIHPKFLFNTLEIISELLSNRKNKDANRVLTLLSEFLRITIYGDDSTLVTLEDEILFLNKYLMIEKTIFNNNFTVQQNIEPETLKMAVPNFLIQPVMEELIGIILQQDTGNYEIFVEAKKKDDSVEIILGIKGNNIKENSIEEIEQGVIYRLTQERMSKLYSGAFELKLNLSSSEGAYIKMLIPINQRNKNEEVFLMESSLEY